MSSLSTLLNARNVSIRPTRWGVLFALMSAVMLLISINYSISLGYFLTFLILALLIVSLLQSWKNIAQLTVEFPSQIAPVFAGDTAMIAIRLNNPHASWRYGITLRLLQQQDVIDDLASDTTQTMQVPFLTVQRGLYALPNLHISSEYPLGLFQIKAVLANPLKLMVYPHPEKWPHRRYTPSHHEATTNANTLHHIGLQDEFMGHRTYQTQDAIQRIDWRASSRSEQLYVKQFGQPQSPQQCIDWDTLPDVNDERRIAKLSYAVMECYQQDHFFSLKLPKKTIPTGRGERHYHQCLEALALL